jgi:Protein of unknown function DUF262
MYGAWLSKEHFSVPHSNPVCTSASLARVESAIRGRVTTYRPASVIAKLAAHEWNLVCFVEKSQCRDIDPKQAVKYEGVRAGTWQWSSTMGNRPPTRETTLGTVDLDAPQ